MNDAANRRTTLEQLAANYPKLQYWHDLLQLARNERGLSDEQQLDVLRLRFAVGDLKTDADYQEMAQLALVAGYPNEAKTLLDKAAADKIVSGERADRLVKMTNDRVTAWIPRRSARLRRRRKPILNASVKLESDLLDLRQEHGSGNRYPQRHEGQAHRSGRGQAGPRPCAAVRKASARKRRRRSVPLPRPTPNNRMFPALWAIFSAAEPAPRKSPPRVEKVRFRRRRRFERGLASGSWMP